MKKIALSLSVLAMAMGFTACDNYDLPNPPAQSNPQEAPVRVDDVVITAGQSALMVLDLKAFSERDEAVPVGAIECDTWPADYNQIVTLYLSATEDMANAKSCETTVVDGVITATPEALNAAYQSITKDPAEATVYASYAVAAQREGGSMLYIGGKDYRFGLIPLTVKPFPVDYVIENTYYLLLGENKIQFTHSEKSPYDDPKFVVIEDIAKADADAGLSWQVVSESGKTYGGDDQLTGSLTEGAKGTIAIDGPVMFTVNMESMTYEINNAYEFIYTPGASNGWSQADSQVLYTSNYFNYSGFVNLDTEFKFCATLDWSVNWGADANNPGALVSNSADNIKVETAGLYYATVNLTELTYALTLIENVGVIGDATAGGWDAQTNLTMESPLVWKGTIHFAGTGEWKLRFNDDWAYNLGGDMANLTEGGANIATPGEGDYDVTLNLSKLPYTCTVVAK